MGGAGGWARAPPPPRPGSLNPGTGGGRGGATPHTLGIARGGGGAANAIEPPSAPCSRLPAGLPATPRPPPPWEERSPPSSDFGMERRPMVQRKRPTLANPVLAILI